MRRMAVVAVGLLSVAGCKKAPEVAAAPKEGWVQSEGMSGACWYPKPFENLPSGERKLYRQQTLEAMTSQWRGQREDGVAFEDSSVAEPMETVLLGKSELIESFAFENLRHCEAAMRGAGTDAWRSWLQAQPALLTENDCNSPLVDRLFWYLDIGLAWQGRANICEGNSVRIHASAIDYYRISDKGPWINAAGDDTLPTIGKTDYPCNMEGCNQGVLILKFTGRSGVEQIFPVGLDFTFKAPEHGMIEVQINDLTWYDNKFKIEKGLEHHTSFEYSPE